MNTGLQFVIAHVADVEAARTFYTEKMGFTVETEQPGFVQFAQVGGAAYALSREEAGAERVELWWFVDDADAECAALEGRGVGVVTPPHDEPFGRAFTVKDAEGNLLNLLQLPRHG